MPGMVDMLRQRLYGDGPGDLTIEDLLPEEDMLEDSDADDYDSGTVYDVENPAVVPSNWGGEFENQFIGEIQSEEQNNMDLREMAQQALKAKAQKRSEIGRQFQKKTAEYNKKGR